MKEEHTMGGDTLDLKVQIVKQNQNLKAPPKI